MGAASNAANVPEILKNIWQDEVHDYQYEDSPGYAMMPKDTTWDGLYQLITVHYGGSSGRSANFGAAKENKGPPKFKQMQIPTRDNFAVWSVDHKLITLSRNQRGALVRALAMATEKAQKKIKRSTSWMIWRDGGGAVGKIQALTTTTLANDTATLLDINDVRNYDIDDVVEFANDSGIANGGILIGQRKVVAIDEDLGQVVFDASLSTIATLAAGTTFIFHAGDYNNVFTGVAAYIPLSKPGTGGVPLSIWGMDRSAHFTRLGGHRFTAATSNLITEVRAALAKAFRRNCNVTHMFCGPEAYDEIDAGLSTSRRYVDEAVGRIGFKGIEFNMQGGKVVKLFSDADIPKSPVNSRRMLYGLNLDSWKFHTATEYPMWLNIDGKKDFMVEENSNASEGRIGGYGQPYTDAAGENFVLEFTT